MLPIFFAQPLDPSSMVRRRSSDLSVTHETQAEPSGQSNQCASTHQAVYDIKSYVRCHQMTARRRSDPNTVLMTVPAWLECRSESNEMIGLSHVQKRTEIGRQSAAGSSRYGDEATGASFSLRVEISPTAIASGPRRHRCIESIGRSANRTILIRLRRLVHARFLNGAGTVFSFIAKQWHRGCPPYRKQPLRDSVKILEGLRKRAGHSDHTW